MIEMYLTYAPAITAIEIFATAWFLFRELLGGLIQHKWYYIAKQPLLRWITYGRPKYRL